MENSVIAIITARGGSKGVPDKNVRYLAGHPLIAHTIQAARECPLLSGCYVTTEDTHIAKISMEYGAKVINRPVELAGDFIQSYPVVEHALCHLQSSGQNHPYFVLLQPTSPLRRAQHITDCVNLLINSSANSVVSVTKTDHHPMKSLVKREGIIQPLFDAESIELPRQQLPPAYNLNGAIYALKTEAFFREKKCYIAPTETYIMKSEESVDIDTEFDLKFCEMLMSRNSITK